MSKLSKQEEVYLRELITSGFESSFIDLKKSWYNLDKKDNKSLSNQLHEFLKDCIAFLNVDMNMDKYLVIGVKEGQNDGPPTFHTIDKRYDENRIQQLITEYIDPIPQIELIYDFEVNGKFVDIVKIHKENRELPYLFRKDVKKLGSSINDYQCQGIGYIRHGSSSDKLTRGEIVNMFNRKKTSVYDLFEVTSNVKSHFSVVLRFLYVLDILIDKSGLDVLYEQNLMLRNKMQRVLQDIIVYHNIFLEESQKFTEYESKQVCKYKDNLDELIESIDGGENSIIIALFSIAYHMYKILYGYKVPYEIKNNDVYITIEDESDYKKIDKCVCYINRVVNELNQSNKGYLKSTNLIQVNSITYNPKDRIRLIQSDVRFKVAEDIIPLLIEPLYQRSNKEEIALRELLQNSMDACKLSKDFDPEIMIQFSKQDNQTVLSFKDNGIGMDLDSVLNYYLTVGKTSKKDHNEYLVGKFGIGALSMFLIGESVKVKTKMKNKHEYQFKLDKSHTDPKIKTVSDLIEKEVDNMESYTIIDIVLKDEYNGLSYVELYKEMGLTSWVIDSENISVYYGADDEFNEVPNLYDYKDLFKKIDVENDLELYIAEYDEQIENKVVRELLQSYNKVMYNGIVTQGNYSKFSAQNLKKDRMPFIIIKSNSERDVDIELSRENLELSHEIFSTIKEYIYRREINRIKKLVNAHDSKAHKHVEEIKALVYKNINLPRILYKKDEYAIGNSSLLKRPEVQKKQYRILGYNSLKDHVKFEADEYYIFDGLNFNKSVIADYIEYGSLRMISKDFLYMYIINATGSNNGFRRAALDRLLPKLLPEVTWKTTNSELWAQISHLKEYILTAIENGSRYGIFPMVNTNIDDIEQLFLSTVDASSVIVTKIDYGYSISNSYDNDFDKILLEEI